MTLDLFDPDPPEPWLECEGEGVFVLRRFALAQAQELLHSIAEIAGRASFRRMITPGGHPMSAAMTCAGPLGWVTDRAGYRYQSRDPQTGLAWPAMPESFTELVERAAKEAGFPGFVPDACLINRYERGAKMGLHQDRDEQDFAWPIVSISLGLPIVFQMGGRNRSDKPRRILLEHGDVLVWGGPARLNYHGVLTLKAGEHPLTGPYRYNLTFRRAG